MLRTLVRWASSNTSRDILELVPRTGRIDLLTDDSVKLGINYKGVKLRPGENLQIVNVRPRGPGQDPTVVVKIATAAVANKVQNKAARKSQPKVRAPKVKEIIVSWLISRHDLEGQKRKAMDSVLKKGDFLQLRLENKSKYALKPSELELQSRKLLVERVTQMLSESGEQAKSSQGSVYTRLMLFYRPKASRS